MFSFFRRPTIKAQLIGQEAKITLSNINHRQTVVLLFSVIRQVAKMLKVDHRFLLNQLVDLDKTLVKNEKKAEKEQRREGYKNKHS